MKEITGKLPGYLSPSAGLKFEDVPNGLAAISKVPALGWAQIIAYMGFCEVSKDQSPGTPGARGDLGWRASTKADPEENKRSLNCELANGRLAMTAIMAMFFQNGITGTTGPAAKSKKQAHREQMCQLKDTCKEDPLNRVRCSGAWDEEHEMPAEVCMLSRALKL